MVLQACAEPHCLEVGRPLRTAAAFAAVTAKPGRAAGAGLAIPARPPGEFAAGIGRSSADPFLSVRVRSG